MITRAYCDNLKNLKTEMGSRPPKQWQFNEKGEEVLRFMRAPAPP